MSRVVKKIWTLRKTGFTTSDHLLIRGLDCEYQLYQEDPCTFEAGGRLYKYAGLPPKMTIITTRTEQEDMLKLKYGEDLILEQVYHEVMYNWRKFPNDRV